MNCTSILSGLQHNITFSYSEEGRMRRWYSGSIIRLLLCFGNVSTFADDREKTVSTYLLGDLGPASRVQSKTDTLSGNKWLMLKGNSMIPMRESAVLGWRQTVGCLGNRAGVCSGGCGGGAKAALASYFLCFLFSINPGLPSQAASLIIILYHESN